MPALETFPDMVVGAGSGNYEFTSLQDFERLYSTMGMGPKNYGWYQCKFHDAAKHIYNAGGKAVLKKMWRVLKDHQGSMTDEELVSTLRKEVHVSVADVFVKWNK